MTLSRHLDKVRVEDLMTAEVETLDQHQSLLLAEAVMTLKRVRHLPVVDAAGRLVGLVTHRDLLRAKPPHDPTGGEAGLAIPVASIMRTEVWTVSPRTPARKAANMLRDHAFGCLPVVDDDQRVVGILTEADYVEAIVTAESDPELPSPTVSDAMTPNPHSITLPATIGDARDLMREHGIRHLPMFNDGELVGMVTDRDLRVADGIAGGAREVALGLLGTDPPYVVDATTPLHAVLDTMADQRRGSAMVVEGGALVGILTTTDACRYLAEWLRAQYPEPR